MGLWVREPYDGYKLPPLEISFCSNSVCYSPGFSFATSTDCFVGTIRLLAVTDENILTTEYGILNPVFIACRVGTIRLLAVTVKPRES